MCLPYNNDVKVRELSKLEKEIMSYIWQYKSCTISQIQLNLKTKYAYTTIATITNRLLEKGVLIRNKKDRWFVYSPKVSQIVYSKKIASNLITTFLSSYGESAFVSFAESIKELPEKQKQHLISILQRKSKN